MWRTVFYIVSIVALAAAIALTWVTTAGIWVLVFMIALIVLGISDITSNNNVLRNYPVIGHIRYWMEFISPEIRQYFLEDDKSGRPFNRQQRNLINQLADGDQGTHPFGTEYDIEASGYRFALHTIAVKDVTADAARVTIGGPQCTQPYSSSRLNISAMSFGALSSRAVLAMNKGAKLGGFAQDTGEGGLAPYHLEYGADVIWEIGSGYFGCRTPAGRFDDEQFRAKAANPAVKMLEIKLSQGAKPGHGGLLPGAKVTEEIAAIRSVPVGEDCLSPAAHAEFSTPTELLEFVARLRELGNGKPVGFKLCIGRRSEFLGICKAMLETGIRPDFITVDGAEGGTGAAPVELSDSIGLPIAEGLPFVHSSLVGCDLRDDIRLIASGKIVNGFDMLTMIALGADLCNMARPMMFAVGCIQALRCHTGDCPTGVTTQDPRRARAIDIDAKGLRVKNYHDATIKSFLTLVGIVGAAHPDELTPDLIWRQWADEAPRTFADIYEYLPRGALLRDDVPNGYAKEWAAASAARF
jgi:glutamate synthase domain-containing protein 2